MLSESRLRPRLLVECEPVDPMPRWARRIIDMGESRMDQTVLSALHESDRSMFTKEGWMKFMVTEKMGRLAVAAQVLTPDQIYFTVPTPMMPPPKPEVMEPRNRHERRRQAKQRRRND